jgi:transcriptional regulator with XRE-family HTH domain
VGAGGRSSSESYAIAPVRTSRPFERLLQVSLGWPCSPELCQLKTRASASRFRHSGKCLEPCSNRKEAMSLHRIELLRLGHRIRRRRKSLRIHLKDWAARCGLGRADLRKIERGNREISFGVLCNICRELSCDIAALTEGIPHLDSKRQSNHNPSKIGVRASAGPARTAASFASPVIGTSLDELRRFLH